MRFGDFLLCPPAIEGSGRSAGRLKTLGQVQNHAPLANVNDAASAVRQFFEDGEVAFRLLDYGHQCPRAKILALRDADGLVSRRIDHGDLLLFDVEALNLNSRRSSGIWGRSVAGRASNEGLAKNRAVGTKSAAKKDQTEDLLIRTCRASKSAGLPIEARTAA